MDATKEVIAETVRQYRVAESGDWAQKFTGCSSATLEATAGDFQVHDVLFDGTARVCIERAGRAVETIEAHVYGRSDGRRAVIDRLVFEQ